MFRRLGRSIAAGLLLFSAGLVVAWWHRLVQSRLRAALAAQREAVRNAKERLQSHDGGITAAADRVRRADDAVTEAFASARESRERVQAIAATHARLDPSALRLRAKVLGV